MKNWMKARSFSLRLISLIFMLILPIVLYFTAQTGAVIWLWLLLILFAACALLLVILG